MTDNAHDFAAHDFFRSDRFVADPYSYFDYLRDQSPVVREPHQGIVMVTGYDEALEIYNDPARFSSCMSTSGPFAGCPIPLEGRGGDGDAGADQGGGRVRDAAFGFGAGG